MQILGDLVGAFVIAPLGLLLVGLTYGFPFFLLYVWIGAHDGN